MVGAYLIYLVSIVLAVYLLLSSHHLTTYKRWFDPAFLLGLALFAWGIGNLFVHHDNLCFQIIAQPFTFLFYVFLLILFQSYPLSPNLYVERWKKLVDLLVLLLLYVTSAVTIWRYPSLDGEIRMLLPVLSGIFVGGIGISVLLSNKNGRFWGTGNWLLVGIYLFLVCTTIFIRHQGPSFAILSLIGFVLIIAGYRCGYRHSKETAVMDEYFYYHERMQFLQREENSNRWLVAFSLIFLTCYPMLGLPLLYVYGIAAVIFILILRLWITRRANQKEIKEIFEISRNLEKRFELHMHEIKSKNEELQWLLGLKQRYETLLVETNAQSMEEVNYENVHQYIEEIVGKWFRTINNVDYLHVVLKTGEGDISYEVTHGKRIPEQEIFSIAVEAPFAMTPGSILLDSVLVSNMYEEQELQRSFMRLLAIHVRGLLGRCLQNQQSLELRLMEQEMEFAAKIQFSLIPKERLTLPQVEAKVVYLPAAYVGGDYVDFVQINSRFSCFLVADISGHGIPASLLTTGLRNSFRAVLQTCHKPREILEQLNFLMYDDLSSTRSFITMFVAVFDTQRQVLWTSRAGHPEPFYLSASKKRILPCSNGMGLGFNKFAVYPQDEWQVEEDFMLLIYTDGLLQLGEGHTMCTQKWLSELSDTFATAKLEKHDLVGAIEQKIWAISRQQQRDDDISVLILDFQARDE